MFKYSCEQKHGDFENVFVSTKTINELVKYSCYHVAFCRTMSLSRTKV